MIEEIRALDAQFVEKTGRTAFGHVSAPTPTSERWVFQDGSVFTKPQQAYVYMLGLLRLAENHPSLLPYPWDQPLAPGQDLRRGEERRPRLPCEKDPHDYEPASVDVTSDRKQAISRRTCKFCGTTEIVVQEIATGREISHRRVYPQQPSQSEQ